MVATDECKKRMFSTKSQAKKALKRSSINKCCHVYHCKICDGWHTTKKKTTAKWKAIYKVRADWIAEYNKKSPSV